MQLPTPGQWFQQRYELGELLGKGGFAAVYRAIDHDVGREVAIKILTPGPNGYEKGLVQRFLREGRIVAGLQDPNTVTMFDFGRTEDDLLFMVFEYIPGRDLAKLLIRTGPMPEAEVAHILRQVLSALREAHAAGILHRDIKPANIHCFSYMGDDRRVKLLDFGIAKPTMKEGEVDELEENKSGMSPGTPRYMSPEQIYGDELTPATDIFSLGLVAYELLSGKPAVSGRTTKETLLNQLSERPILLPPFLRVNPQLRALVERMCLKRAAQRPQSVQEVLRELNAIADLNTSRALPSPQERTAAKPVLPVAVSEKLTTIGLVVAAIVILALVAIPVSKIVKRALDKPEHPGIVIVPRGAEVKTRPNPNDAPVEVEEPQEEAPQPFVSGCGAALSSGVMTITYEEGSTERQYVLYVPANYEPHHKHPLVLMLRDDRPARQFLLDTNFTTVADEHNLLLVAPVGVTEAPNWNPQADVVWLTGMLRDVAALACVDPTRRFGYAEFSSGGALEALTCHMPFTGIANASYLPKLNAKTTCTPAEPVPTIQLFGEGNIFPAPSGTSPCSAGAQHRSWRSKVHRTYAQNDCSGDAKRWGNFSHGTCYQKACRGAATAHCDMEDAYEPSQVHILPGIDIVAKDFCQSTPTKFDVPATVWQFFSELDSLPAADDP